MDYSIWSVEIDDTEKDKRDEREVKRGRQDRLYKYEREIERED